MRALIFIPLIFLSCNRLPLWMHDSPIEEKIEDMIMDRTGIAVDFTGESPETKK